MDFSPLAFLTILAILIYAVGLIYRNYPIKLLAFATITISAFLIWQGLAITETIISTTGVSPNITSTTITTPSHNNITDAIALIYLLMGFAGGVIEVMAYTGESFRLKRP
jgi:hypothetical protein